jgi:DNA-directed RNA polymerase subunit F
MPKVPELNRSVSTRALNLQNKEVRASETAFGGGPGVQRAIGAVSGLIETQKNQADDAQFKEAAAEISKRETESLYGENGALRKKGKDSFESYDPTMKGFDDSVNELKQNYNPRVQRRIDEYKLRSKGNLDKAIQRHMFSEGQKYETQATKSLVKNEQNAAIENFNDPDRIWSSLNAQVLAIGNEANNKGWDEDTKDLEIGKAIGQTHYGVISKMVNGGADQEAVEHYEKNKKTIPGDYRQQIEKVLDVGKLRGESQRAADDIVNKNESLSTALESARSIEDPKKRDEVVRRVKQQFSDRKSAERFDQERTFEAFNDILVKENGNLDALPAAQLTDLTASQERNLKDYARKLRSGEQIERNSAEYYDLLTMASSPATRNKFLQTNLRDPKYLNSINSSQLSELMKTQVAARKGDSKTNKLLDGIQTKNSIINGALDAAEIEYGKSANKENNEKANKFRSAVDKLVTEQQDKLGRELTNEEVRDITENLMVEVVTDDGWFVDTKKKVFELKAEESGEVKFSEIPARDKEEISAILRKMNKPVNNENIQAMYIAKLNRLRSK